MVVAVDVTAVVVVDAIAVVAVDAVAERTLHPKNFHLQVGCTWGSPNVQIMLSLEVSPQLAF